MANRIVQAVYDLKDNITGKLRSISDALRGNQDAAEKAAAGVERANARASQSYGKAAEGIASFRKTLVALAAVVGLDKLKDGLGEIIATGEKFGDLEKQLATAFGGVDAGKKAFSDLQEFAKGVPVSFEEVVAAAVALRRNGIDPLDGSLQALIDNQQALDGTTEDLQATIETLGKAYTKGELSLKAIVSLTEQGVPVFDLLSRATGQSEVKLRALAESGQLGQDAIRSLISALGDLRKGAAADELGDTDAQIQKLKDSAAEFLNTIAQSGALEFFQGQLADLNKAVDEAAKSGRLGQIAKGISDAIVNTASAVGRAVAFVYDYSGALLELGKTYAAFKIAGFLTQIAAATSAMIASATATRAAAAAMASAGTAGSAGAAGVGLLARAINLIRVAPLAYLVLKIIEVSDALVKLKDAQEEQRAADQDLADSKQQLIDKLAALEAANSRFADVAVLASEDVVKQSREQARAYEEQLQGAIRYYSALRTEAKLTGDENGMREAAAKVAELKAALDLAKVAAAQGADVLSGRLSKGAQDVADAFAGATQSAAAAGDVFKKLFDGLDSKTVTQLGDIGLGLVQVARQSDTAAQSVRDGLSKELESLTGEQLLRFQSASIAAFDTFGVGAKDSAAVLEATLLAAMTKLGVSPTQFGLGMTQAGEQAAAAFQTITENALATSAQIESAFKAAVRGAGSKEDLDALGASLEAAANRGRIGMEAAERAALALNARLRELQEQADPLADVFGRLGIKSQKALDDARDSAEEAFNAIVDGANRGLAAQEDVRRAFVAYAQAALDAARDSDASARAQVEHQLQIQAAVLGVTDALGKLGIAGQQATGAVADNATRAAEALGNLATSADDAAGSADRLADSSAGAAKKLQDVEGAAQSVAVGIGNVSKAFLDAAASGGRLDAIEFGKLQEQQQAANDYLQRLEQEIAGTDELSRRVRELRSQYSYLGDEQLRVIAEREKQLSELRQREDERSARDQRSQGGGSGSKSGSGAAGAFGGGGSASSAPAGGAGAFGAPGITINVNAGGSIIGGTKQEIAEQLARLVLPQLKRLASLGAA